MISESCVVAAVPLGTLAQKVRAFITIASIKADGGLTVTEFGELFLALMRLAVETADTIDSAGSLKKEMVLDALGELFDEIADKMVPTYMWPFWVIFKSAIRASLLAAASGAIEIVLKMVRNKS